MRLLFRTSLAAIILTCATATMAWAQEVPAEQVAGQEAIAGVGELSEAIDLLYVYPVSEGEMEDFYLTMTSLTAWARVHGFEWNGMIDSYPMLEALRGLTYWEAVGRSPEPFCTTFAKVSLLSNFADPKFDVRDGANDYLDHHRGLFEADEIAEEDVEMVQESMALALEHLAQLNSIPEENRRLYIRELGKIDLILQEVPLMGLLPEQPGIAFRSSLEGLMMRANGYWSRSQMDTEPVFDLAGSSCYVAVYSAPWFEDDVLDDAMMDNIVASLAKKEPSLVVDARLRGDLEGRPDYRLHFQLEGDHPRGMIYTTAVGETLHILLFRYAAEEEGLLRPILEECCTNLEFGDYELPLLLDRSEVGYQVFAEEPWMAIEISSPSADYRLSFGELPFYMDIAVTDGINFGLEKFIEIIPALAEATGDRFITPVMEETRMVEVDGLPCAMIQATGIPLQSNDDITVHLDFFILNGDRIIGITAVVPQEIWSEYGPMIENLVVNMKLTRIAPTLTPEHVLIDQSHKGFVVIGQDPWETTYDDLFDIWGLKYGDSDFSISFLPEGGFDSADAELSDFVLESQQFDLQLFDNPTLGEIVEVQLQGRTCMTYEMFGLPTQRTSSTPADAEHSYSLFIPLEGRILRVSVSGKHEDWEKRMPLVDQLVADMKFPSRPPLLIDEGNNGYAIYAQGPWETDYDAFFEIWELSYADLPFSINITTYKSLPSTESSLTHLAPLMLEEAAKDYESPTPLQIKEIVIDGRACLYYEFHGLPKSLDSPYYGQSEHRLELFIPQNSQLLGVTVTARHADWESISPVVSQLFKDIELTTLGGGNVRFSPEVSLLLDREEAGYRIFANGLWAVNENVFDWMDAGVFSQKFGCYIDITVVEQESSLEGFLDFSDYIHNLSMDQYVEPNSVGSGNMEMDGRSCGFSEIFGVKAEGEDFAGVDVHTRQLFLLYNKQILHVSIRTKSADWEAAKPHIEKLLRSMKFPDVPG